MNRRERLKEQIKGGTAVVVAGAMIAGGYTTITPNDAHPEFTDYIKTTQGQYYQQYGHYIQVLPEGKLPSDTPAGQNWLPADPPQPYRIDVWEKPDGTKGYEVKWLNQSTESATSTRGRSGRLERLRR